MKKWTNTELKEPEATRFRFFLRENGIAFETSYAGFGYVHFEVYVSEKELETCNSFIDIL